MAHLFSTKLYAQQPADLFAKILLALVPARSFSLLKFNYFPTHTHYGISRHHTARLGPARQKVVPRPAWLMPRSGLAPHSYWKDCPQVVSLNTPCSHYTQRHRRTNTAPPQVELYYIVLYQVYLRNNNIYLKLIE